MCLLQFPLETEGMTQHSEYDKCLVKASDWEGFCNRMCGAVPLLGPGHASICSGASGCPCVCGHPHQPTRLGNQAPAVALLAGAAASRVLGIQLVGLAIPGPQLGTSPGCTCSLSGLCLGPRHLQCMPSSLPFGFLQLITFSPSPLYLGSH